MTTHERDLDSLIDTKIEDAIGLDEVKAMAVTKTQHMLGRVRLCFILALGPWQSTITGTLTFLQQKT
eukprot:1378423-Amphidinium_carterae.1